MTKYGNDKTSGRASKRETRRADDLALLQIRIKASLSAYFAYLTDKYLRAIITFPGVITDFRLRIKSRIANDSIMKAHRHGRTTSEASGQRQDEPPAQRCKPRRVLPWCEGRRSQDGPHARRQ